MFKKNKPFPTNTAEDIAFINKVPNDKKKKGKPVLFELLRKIDLNKVEVRKVLDPNGTFYSQENNEPK